MHEAAICVKLTVKRFAGFFSNIHWSNMTYLLECVILQRWIFFCNSLFYTRNVGLIAFYLQQAVEKSTRKNLKDVDQAESEEIISNLVYPAVVQCEKEALKIGNWRYGKDDVLLQIHGWFYMSWMSTKFDSFDKVFVPIGTVFYAQVVEICHFEQYLIEVLKYLICWVLHYWFNCLEGKIRTTILLQHTTRHSFEQKLK